MKKALITGITGQDGSYLAEFLLSQGYEVHGMVRRTSTFNRSRIDHITVDSQHMPGVTFCLHYGDMIDATAIVNLVQKIQPDEIYNLAAQSVAQQCLCPILSAQKMEYRTLDNLWDEQIRKNKKVRVEYINGIKTEVINLPNNKQLRALGMWNGMGTWFPIRQISRHWWKGKMAKMSQKFGSIIVTPNHSILDINQKIREPKENPWLLNIRKLNYQPKKYRDKIYLKLDGVYKEDRTHFWLDEKGVIGKVLKIIKGDKIKAFCRFVGAFISEGHTVFNKTNGNWYVGISNGDKKWLKQIEQDLKTFYKGKYWYIRHKKSNFEDVWELQIKSRALYNLCKKLLGLDSGTKQLPYWFSQIRNEYLMEIWGKMMEGDGCINEETGFRYTTKSYKLACQLGWLFTTLGYDYTVHEEINKGISYWHFRECTTYQPCQGSSTKKLEWIDYNGWVYDITVNGVNNFAIGIGNIVVHNSHVRVSFETPEYTSNADALGVLRILEAIKLLGLIEKVKFYQASTSELYGKAQEIPQTEKTPFYPRNPYAVAKLYAHWIVKNYREAYGLFASNGILFNHESPRRGETFVTRKITQGIARIKAGLDKKIYLGNLEAKRDWGFAPEYVEAMHKMLQQEEPGDYVIATGETHSIKEFLEKAFEYAELDDWQKYISIESRYFRPSEVDVLVGDASLAKEKLGWEPKIKFNDLIKIMIDADFRKLNIKSPGEGDRILKEKFPNRWWEID